MNNINENITPAPSLPPDLSFLYSSLPVDMQRLFRKVFVFLWNKIAPARSFVSNSGVIYSYWAVDMLRIRTNLTTSELSALSYLYQITEKGAKTVKSETIYNGMLLPEMVSESKITLLHTLKRKGYIIRLTRDPSAPYLLRSISRQPVFMQMTPKGVGVIHDIEKGLYKILLNTSFNEITGANKKPGYIESAY